MGAFIAAAAGAHDALLAGLGGAAWAAAAALLVPKVREWISLALDRLDAAGPGSLARAVLACGALAAAYLCFLKSCQYYGFQLPSDTSYMVNSTANFLAGRGLASTVFGVPSVLSVHFAFFVPVFLSPVLFFWPSALALLFLQSAALASMGPAAYFLARRRCGNGLALVLMALVLAHPSLQAMAASNLDDAVFLAPLTLWGMALWASGRGRWAAVALLLALTTREQVPITIAGAGLCWGLFADRPWRRRAVEGAAVVLGAAALWFAEMRVVAAHGSALEADLFSRYSNLGNTPSEVIGTVLSRPWLLARAMVWPPAHIAPLAATALFMGLFPLAHPPTFVFFWLSSAHHLLQANYVFELREGAYSFAPLVLAAAFGLARLGALPKLRGRRAWILAPALAAVGLGLRGAPRTLLTGFGEQYLQAAPPLAALVPPKASVWAEEYVGVWLAARPELKLIHGDRLSLRFDELLFRPEYVLLDKGTLLFLPPDDKERVLGFLAREGYAKVSEAGSLVLLKDPDAPRGGFSPSLTLERRAEDAGRLEAYLVGILDSERSRTLLADLPPDLRYEPEGADQRMRFAQLLLTRGLTAQAAPHAKQAVAMRPDQWEGRAVLADVLAKQGDWEGALREYEAAASLNPRSADVLMGVGNHLLRGGKVGAALRRYDEALLLEPGKSALHSNRGVALQLIGRREKARLAFLEALRLDPGNATAKRHLAQPAVAERPVPKR
ncbi:MAG: DUF2079 domain-containing protein [Elusimicrobia bacterium]|nr:DUF2079 domain-containing protein [Elusimicrobiota bacterium]